MSKEEQEFEDAILCRPENCCRDCGKEIIGSHRVEDAGPFYHEDGYGPFCDECFDGPKGGTD